MGIDDLARGFPRIAAGGLAAVCGAVSIGPSCCCGIEGWREWQGLLSKGESPWLGHDPSPWVEKSGDDFLVWSDGGVNPVSGPLQSIRFTREHMATSLTAVEGDLRAFATRLGAKLPDGRTLTDAIARRDTLAQEHALLLAAIAGCRKEPARYGVREIKWIATLEVSKLQKQADDLARNIRELNALIQQANWSAELAG